MRILFAIALITTLSGCGKGGTYIEIVRFDEPIMTAADCIQQFEENATAWKGKQVNASFFYDVTGLGNDYASQFWSDDPANTGEHSITIVQSNFPAARRAFLEQNAKGDTAALQAKNGILFRTNESSDDFAQLMRIGCERLRPGVSLVQVAFLRDYA